MAAKKPEERVGKVETIHCGICHRPTKHTIRASYGTQWEEYDGAIWGSTAHDLLECNGCGAVTYRKTSWFSEEDGETVTLYPAPIEPDQGRQPKDYDDLAYGSPLESVYRQTISALNQKLPTLTAAGVRFMVEGICNEQGIVKGPVTGKNGTTRNETNLEGRINGMVDRGLIAKNQAKTLHEIRFVGNDAAHQLDHPPQQVLTAAIDVVEHILAQIYQQPLHEKKIATRKRPKARRKKKSATKS